MPSRNIRDGLTHFFIEFNGKDITFEDFEKKCTQHRLEQISKGVRVFHNTHRLKYWAENRNEIKEFFDKLNQETTSSNK